MTLRVPPVPAGGAAGAPPPRATAPPPPPPPAQTPVTPRGQPGPGAGEAPAAGADVVRIRDDHSLYWLLHPPRVAIIGVPNAGKSTLANRLFAQERSITADLPGTTRDWVGEIANVDGLAVMLVDTPGLRHTDDPIESEAIRRSKGQIERADLVVLVLDVTQPRDPDQLALEAAHRCALVVVNKSDQAA